MPQTGRKMQAILFRHLLLEQPLDILLASTPTNSQAWHRATNADPHHVHSQYLQVAREFHRQTMLAHLAFLGFPTVDTTANSHWKTLAGCQNEFVERYSDLMQQSQRMVCEGLRYSLGDLDPRIQEAERVLAQANEWVAGLNEKHHRYQREEETRQRAERDRQERTHREQTELVLEYRALRRQRAQARIQNTLEMLVCLDRDPHMSSSDLRDQITAAVQVEDAVLPRMQHLEESMLAQFQETIQNDHLEMAEIRELNARAQTNTNLVEERLRAIEAAEQVAGESMPEPNVRTQADHDFQTIRSRLNPPENIIIDPAVARSESGHHLAERQILGNECPICTDPYNDHAMLPCRHVFCFECIVSWLSMSETSRCPTCRQKAHVMQIRRLVASIVEDEEDEEL